MENIRVIIDNGDGTVGILIPASNSKRTLAEIIEKSVPNRKSHRVIDISKIPSDRTFRGAWTDDNPTDTVDVDMEKAKNIHMEIIRRVRNDELDKLDKEELLARRGAHPQEKSEQNIWDEKQILQDIPNTLLNASGEVTLATTPEALRNIWPSELPEEL